MKPTKGSERRAEFSNAMEKAKQAAALRDRAEEELIRQYEQMEQELQMAAEFQRAILPEVVDLPLPQHDYHL